MRNFDRHRPFELIVRAPGRLTRSPLTEHAFDSIPALTVGLWGCVPSLGAAGNPIRRRDGPQRILVTIRRGTSGGLIRVVHVEVGGEVETEQGGHHADRDDCSAYPLN